MLDFMHNFVFVKHSDKVLLLLVMLYVLSCVIDLVALFNDTAFNDTVIYFVLVLI